MNQSNNATFLCALAVSLLCAFGSPACAEEITLEKAYELTLEQSESLKISEQEIRAANARYDEAVASIYPEIGFTASERIRDSAARSSGNDSSFDSGTQFSGSRKDRFTTAFTVSQPLFSGFRDFLVADAASFEISALKLSLERQRELLYQNVAELFFQTLLYSSDLAQLKASEKVLTKRISELEDFVRLGKSRESEQLSARSDLDDNRAEQARTIGLLVASKEMLAFLTGIPASNISLKEVPNLIKRSPVDHYLERLDDRADLKALRERVLSADKLVTAAERERWPSVSLEANAYPYSSPESNPGADVLVRLSLPIFDFGRIEARTEQQRAVQSSLELQAEQLRRTIERDVRVAYAELERAEKEKLKLITAVQTSRKSYESQRNDYEFGTVTNITVLQAIRQLQEAERRLARAEIEEKLSRERLKVAVGGVRS